VADSIREGRDRRGWRREDLARLAQVEVGALGRLELAQNVTLPLRELWKVSRALGVRVCDLLPPELPPGDRRVG
jgi:transcriptional regulator with XRE-family HTH domain